MSNEGTVFKAVGRVNQLSVMTIDAYGVAVKNGFEGTVEEWLASLHGKDYVLTPADKTEIAEMAAELVEVPESSGGISVTGAKVGQTVKISAVDENGVPTAWDPTDFPSGGGGKGAFRLIRTVTIPEDASTDKSGVTWLERENGGYWFGFDTDMDGNPFEVTEMLVYNRVAPTTTGGSPNIRCNNGPNPTYGDWGGGVITADLGTTAKYCRIEALGAFSLWNTITRNGGGGGDDNNATDPGGAMSSITSISTWHNNHSDYGLTAGTLEFYGR
jgi:hypothetical protein